MIDGERIIRFLTDIYGYITVKQIPLKGQSHEINPT